MPFIKLDGVSLEFPGVVHKRGMSVTSVASVSAPGGKMQLDDKNRLTVRALDNITIDIQAGDRVALIGHNGAGKSTLLRALAGLYRPTLGSLQVEGKIAPLFNLNFGIDLEASGYENILIRGLFLGMSKSEIENKMESIADFCELGDFLHLPVRTYSSGMSARLGFAISTHIDAEILLLDEAIGTGDAAFFKKACSQIENFISSANILVLASHSNKILRQFCEKGILLEHGRVVLAGPLDDVLHAYRDIQKKGVSVGLGAAERQIQLHNDTIEQGFAVSNKSIDTSMLVLNDDYDYSPNPGCELVRNAYKVLFSGIIGDDSVWNYIPGHYWTKSFGHLGSDKFERLTIKPGEFATGAETVAELDINEWEEIRLELIKSDPYILQKFKSADIVLINGSNCMHHNMPRSLSLLALMKSAVSAGVKVILANATVQMMDSTLLKEVLPLLELVHVRDRASQVYLETLGLKSVCTADVAFLGMKDMRKTGVRYLNAEEYVLVTGGVAVNENSLKVLFEGIKEFGMRAVYLCVGDAGEEDIVTAVCENYSVPIVLAKEIEFEALVSFLAQFRMAVSGRHYINILLMRAGVPYVILPSDTWVSEETCKLLNCSFPAIKLHQQILEGLQNVQDNNELLHFQCMEAVELGESSVLTLKKDLAAIIEKKLDL